MRRLRGHAWFIRRYGLRTWLHYEKVRRSGAQVDYSAIFTPSELARLVEHYVPAPWELRS